MKSLKSDILIYGDNISSFSTLSNLISSGLSIILIGPDEYPLLSTIFTKNDRLKAIYSEDLQLLKKVGIINIDIIKNEKLDYDYMFNKMRENLTHKNITYIPSSLPVSISREKNRIRSIIFSNGFSKFKIKSRIIIDTSSSIFMSKLSNDYMIQTDGKNFPQVRRVSPDEKIISSLNDHILTKSGLERINQFVNLNSSFESDNLILPERLSIFLPKTRDDDGNYSSIIHTHQLKKFNLNDHRSVRYWNLLYFGYGTPFFRKTQYRNFTNRDLLISSLLASFFSSLLVKKKSANPPVYTKDVEFLLNC